MSQGRQLTGDELADMVDKGEDISEFLPEKLVQGFTKKLIENKREKHVIRTTVDLGSDIMKELSEIANLNNISKAAVIKMAVFDYVMKFRHYKSTNRVG